MRKFIFSGFICLVSLNIIAIGPHFGKPVGTYILWVGVGLSIVFFLNTLHYWSEWNRDEWIKEMVKDYNKNESELYEMSYDQVKALYKKLGE